MALSQKVHWSSMCKLAQLLYGYPLKTLLCPKIQSNNTIESFQMRYCINNQQLFCQKLGSTRLVGTPQVVFIFKQVRPCQISMKNFKNLQRFKHLFEKHTIISTFRSVRGKKMYLEYVYRPVVHIFAIFPWTLYGRWRAVIISRPRNLRLAYTWLVKTLRLSCKSPKTANFVTLVMKTAYLKCFDSPSISLS